MNSHESNDPESTIEEEATVWLLEREEGFAPGRAEAFAEWCGKNARHAQAAARAERTLAILEEMPSIRGPLVARVSGAGDKPQKNSALRRSPVRRWAVAAGIAAAVVISSSMWWRSQLQVAAQVYEALGAEPQRISLADGSVVDLNANSRVEVQFSDDERRLTLVSGEAHFQVAHNKARPFIVTAHGVSVRAVGTAFNVRLADDRVDVLVDEGKVKVDRQEKTAFFATRQTPLLPLLAAGEKTEITVNSDAAPRVREIASAEMGALLSWQNRMTSFADVPLGEMVIRINRCNSLQLVLGDPQLGERKVGGVIDLGKVNAFVQLLEQEGDINADRSAAGKIVLRRSR